MLEAVQFAAIMARASDERWCADWACGTCGAHQIRSAFEELSDKHSYEEIASALAAVGPGLDLDIAEWLLRALSHPWNKGSLSSRKLEEILSNSPAGVHYKRMLAAKFAADARRREHELRNDPNEVIRLRAEKKQVKAEQHQKRLEAKKLRDAAYYARAKDQPQ